MSATIHIKTTVQPGGKIEVNAPELPEGAEVIVTIESNVATRDYVYDPATDPIAQFIGAFDSGDAPPLDAREVDQVYIGKDPHAQSK